MNTGMVFYDEWRETGNRNGWVMPSAPKWKRLPIIRHIRAIRHAWFVHENETFWGRLGLIPSGYDRWVLHGIWEGLERAARTESDRP